MYLLICKRKN